MKSVGLSGKILDGILHPIFGDNQKIMVLGYLIAGLVGGTIAFLNQGTCNQGTQ